MLTIETSSGFTPAYHYPTYEYKQGSKGRAMIDGSRIVPCPDGYEEKITHASIEEHFADYVKHVEDEHKDLSNEELCKAPPFIGRGRNARWLDAQSLRGLS